MDTSELRELCRRGLDQEKLYSMIYQSVSSIDDLESNEVEFLVNYAMQDLRHYLYTKLGIYDLEEFDEAKAREVVCEELMRNEERLRIMINEWFNWWLIKWRQRVRLVFGTNNEDDPKSKEISRIMESIPKDTLRKYARFIVRELVMENELCSLDVIADFVIKSTIQELVDEHGEAGAVRIMSSDSSLIRLRLLRKILEVTKSRQPIVILRVRLNPYQ